MKYQVSTLVQTQTLRLLDHRHRHAGFGGGSSSAEEHYQNTSMSHTYEVTVQWFRGSTVGKFLTIFMSVIYRLSEQTSSTNSYTLSNAVPAVTEIKITVCKLKVTAHNSGSGAQWDWRERERKKKKEKDKKWG